jgi:hypothetical protein
MENTGYAKSRIGENVFPDVRHKAAGNVIQIAL